jgi:hypothetical protein
MPQSRAFKLRHDPAQIWHNARLAGFRVMAQFLLFKASRTIKFVSKTALINF